MEFKIDESKIVKITVKNNDDSLTEFNVENGLIIGVANNGSKASLSDGELMDKLKNTDFYQKIEERAKENWNKESEVLTKTAPILEKLRNNDVVKTIQNIIKKDSDGELDKIASESQDVKETLNALKKRDENADKELDHDMCLRNIEKRKEELVKMLGTNNFVSLQKNEDFQKKLADYQDELKRKDEIEADMEADITED